MSPVNPNEIRFEEHIERELNSLNFCSRNYKDYDVHNQSKIKLKQININTNIFLTINPFSEISENKIF